MADQKTVDIISNEIFPLAFGGALGILDSAKRQGFSLKYGAQQLLMPEEVEILFRPAPRQQQIKHLTDICAVAFAAAAQLKALEK
ncbi:MAG: hypothetical protein IJH68_08515 [Thermoguttaceae bacterium]|nr:hypothetical protein [Thermoguttaceae bacterium]